MLHQPKLTVPDVDNYVKALLDAVYDNDSEVWDFRGVKVWSDMGYIEIWGTLPLPTPARGNT